MTSIVLGEIDQFDFLITHEKVDQIDSIEEIREFTSHKTYIAPVSEENLGKSLTITNHVYIPATELLSSNVFTNGYVYFDLETYPFFQKVKEQIDKSDKRKGVFRFRRITTKENSLSVLVCDLYVLSSLFGKLNNIRVKHSKKELNPAHTIVLVNFECGVMAHIECTTINRERIELEWSGIKHIIEFDSDEMRPVLPCEYSNLPLAFTVDAVKQCAHKVEKSLIEQLKDFQQLLSRRDDE